MKLNLLTLANVIRGFDCRYCYFVPISPGNIFMSKKLKVVSGSARILALGTKRLKHFEPNPTIICGYKISDSTLMRQFNPHL